MDTEHKKLVRFRMKWYDRWKLNERGRCGHVKDILKDGEAIGAIELDNEDRYEIFKCKTCGYIYCGRVPLKYYLEKASKV